MRKKKREDKCSGELFRARLAPRISRGHFPRGLFTVSLNGRSERGTTRGGAPTMSIYKDFMVSRLCQFTEILWCPDYVNLQSFYGAPTMSIYRDFMGPRLCQFTEISHDQAKRVKSL